MSVMFNGKQITGMMLNGHKIVEGKLNNQTLFKFEGTPYMSFQMDTNQASETFQRQVAVPFKVGEYGNNLGTITILWGDGNKSVINNGSVTSDSVVHTYQNNGIYDIYIYSENGKIPEFNFGKISNGVSINMRRLIKMITPILPMIDTSGNPALNSISKMFYYAVNLEYIPENIFSLNNQGEDFSYVFSACYKLTTVPEKVFSYCPNIKNISYAFYLSTGLISVPENLFSNNTQIEDISSLFNGCDNLQELPSNLIKPLVNLTKVTSAFRAKSLSSIPTGFFDNNIKLTDAGFAFMGSGITSVPEYLFKYNTSVNTFQKCFADCTKLQLNQNIFCNESEEKGTRFAGQNINFTDCFNRTSYSGSQGTAPQLWNYTYNSVTGTGCFSGNTSNALTNYYIIPETWGGPYKDNTMTIIINTSLNTSLNKKYSLPWFATTYSDIGNITINWGDGKSTSITNKTITASNKAHTYSTDGTYVIVITSSNGNIPAFASIAGEESYCTILQEVQTPLLHMYDPILKVEETTLSCFSGCTNLSYVYEHVFSKNKQATSLGSLFRNCKKITSMPDTILDDLPNLTDLSYSFQGSGLTSMSVQFMKKCPNVENVSSMFSSCESITSIPEDLFKYNLKITDFSSCFERCSSLSQIPSNLFRYNTEAKTFYCCFQVCHSLLTVPEYLFRYNLKAESFGHVFAGCFNLTINKNIFCDEATEMTTRFATGDIYIYWSPAISTLDFGNAFESVMEGEAPQLWNYTYKINVDEGDEENPQVSIYDWAYGYECFTHNTGTFTNNILNYSLIPSSWGGEYVPNTMTFKIDTTKFDSSNTTFVLPFVSGTYNGLGKVTIDWGDTTYNERNVVVGDNLSNAQFALNFPDNLSSSLPSYDNDIFILCGEKREYSHSSLEFVTNYYNYDAGGWEADIWVYTDGKANIIIPERGWIYVNSSDNESAVKYDEAKIGYCSGGLYVSKINTSNPAYQYVKLKVPNNQTEITDGIITEDICTHNYSKPGVYTITVTSSNSKIPRMHNTSLYYGTRLITQLRDTILHMVNEDGTDATDITGLFASSPITSIPISLFYYNRNIEDVSNLFEQNQMTDVPAGLFGYLLNLKNVSNCFSGCTALTSIPKALFYTTPLLEDVSYCFNGCTSMSTIPGTLFLHNPLITNFSNCFKSCSSLTSIGTDLFCDEKEDKDTRFANAEIDFSSCFANAGSSTNTITLPDLWNYTYYLVNSKNCFSEFNGTPVNWNEVPVGWGGNKKTFTLNISIPSDDLSFIVPFKPGTYSYSGGVQIDWGDNSTTTINSPITQEQCSHTYNSSGLYSITLNVLGNMMPLFSFGNTSPVNASKLLSVEGTLGRMSNTDDDIVENLAGEQINVANFDYMFSGCSNLTKVSSSLLQLNDGDQMNNVYPNAVRMFEDSGIESLIENFFPALGEDVNACFYNCKNLIKIPQLIGASNYNSCFYGCTSLVDIPYDTFAWRGQGNSKSKTFNFCFSNCTSLKSIPDRLFLFLDEEGVDEFTGCFNNCINLETIPDGLFENTTAVDYSGCFSACDKLKINPNIFGSSVDRFSKLKDNQTVDLNSMFALASSFKGTSKGTAPELWNYVYAPANYVNIFQQENDKSETKSGVDVTYNVNSSILINGSALGQADFISETFTFNINPSRWYNFALEKNDGSVTQTSTYLLKLTLTNSAGTEYYSKIFSTIDDLGKWEGLNFVSSSSSTFQLTIRIYGGNAYDNLSITPKLSLAKVTFSQCFKGQTTNSLLNYNNIPSSWK